MYVDPLIWKVYLLPVLQLNHPEVPTLPEQISMDDLAEQDDLLQLIHRVLFDVG